jgi:predicted nucleotide-binding protein
MARLTKPPPKQPAQLTPQQMTAGIERLRKRREEVERFNPLSVTDQHNTPELDALEAAVDDTLVRTFGADTLDYQRYKSAAEFDRGPYNYAYKVPPQQFQASVARSKDSSLALLAQAIKALEEQLEEHASSATDDQEIEAPPRTQSSKIFVVHGHDEGVLEAVARFLEKIELEAIILKEQPDQGFTIIEKFQAYADQVSFAVVLLTPDDIGGAVSSPNHSARARQNVIFELGYFVGKLGRGRACLLRKGAVEIPSDLYGVIYTDFDSADGWKLKLIRELKAAKLEFDANKAW